MDIAILLRKYLPEMVSFGMFARVTDIASKSVEELKNLRHMKITGILPKDKAMIIRELDKAIAEFPEQELRAYRNRVWHL